MATQVTNYQCPACTGPLQFDADTGKLGCEYCGSSYIETPYNAYCYKHCDYRPWGGNAPAEYSGYTPPHSDDDYYYNDPDALPPDEDDIYGDDEDDWFN